MQQLGATREAARADAGLESRRLRDLPTFVPLLVGRELDRCEVDLAIDFRALDVEAAPLDPTLAPKELEANKVLAVFDRAEPRDFTDLDALASFRRFTSADLQVSPQEHARLGGIVSTWRQLVEQQIERKRDSQDRGLGR